MLIRTCLALLLALPALHAAELIVTISGITNDQGEIGCALFRDAAGFPMASSKAIPRRLPANPGSLECRFANLPAGAYALAVAHDLNRNGRTDTNFVGMPKEDWGVSNNVRPKLRAPKFEEARFTISEGEVARQEVKLGR